MMTNSQLSVHPHPLIYAFELQKKIQAMKDDIAGMEIEYNQIVIYCKEHGVTTQDGFVVRTRETIRRTISPELFARTFPEENELLVRKRAMFIGTELDKLVETKILPSIRIEDAKELIGNAMLDKACLITVSEKVTIVKEDTI
jgi:hypothetical protein